jgi:hypothetical protein
MHLRSWENRDTVYCIFEIEYAAAFFLLADRLQDAISICIKSLNDVQLAVCICRIYEGDDSPILTNLINTKLIPDAAKSMDRWLSTILWTMLKRRDNAFYAIMRPLHSMSETELILSEHQTEILDPNLILLLEHLKEQYGKLVLKDKPFINRMEYLSFVWQCVKSYDHLGCPSLALQLISNYKLDTIPEYTMDKETIIDPKTIDPVEEMKLGNLDWSAPSTVKTAEIDWGEMEAKVESGLNWDEMDVSKEVELDNLEAIQANDLEGNTQKEKFVTSTNDSFVSRVLILRTEEILRIKIRTLNTQIYIRFLIMRLLSDIHQSADMLVIFKSSVVNESTLSKYFEYTRKGFSLLSELTRVNIAEIVHMIISRCQEIYTLNIFVVS